MYSPTEVVEVFAWGKRVGAVSLDPFSGLYVFQYNQNWLRSGVELSPFSLPIARGKRSFAFPSLPKETFKQLPPMLADSLPDKFGNALIDAALSDMGIPKENVTPLDRLAYMSDRSMGALEFRPPPRKSRLRRPPSSCRCWSKRPDFRWKVVLAAKDIQHRRLKASSRSGLLRAGHGQRRSLLLTGKPARSALGTRRSVAGLIGIRVKPRSFALGRVKRGRGRIARAPQASLF